MLLGPQFSERVRVETVRANGPAMIEAGVVGLRGSDVPEQFGMNQWLYGVAECHGEPRLEAIKDPARLPWHEVTKVDHDYLDVNAMMRPMPVRERLEG